MPGVRCKQISARHVAVHSVEKYAELGASTAQTPVEFFAMPSHPPLCASGSRELKRPRSIPRAVRSAIALMVFGRVNDPDYKPVDFIAAANECGIKPHVFRRYLDQPHVRAHLFAERRAFRAMINAGNEGALLAIRDKAANKMASISAIRVLQELDAEDAGAHRNGAPQQSPGVVIRILVPAPPGEPPMRDVTPSTDERLTQRG